MIHIGSSHIQYISHRIARLSSTIYAHTSNFSTVTTLTPLGVRIFATGTMAGPAVGTPVTTKDGQYILVTTNPTLSTGLFSVFNIDSPGTAVLSFPTSASRFSAIGAFWDPVQG